MKQYVPLALYRDDMFTAEGVDEGKIISPPVIGCNCTYCHNMTLYHCAVKGHASQPSHRLSGGDEHHNPENKARLALRALVTPEMYAEYVSKPGGHILWFQHPQSKLWYASGRLPISVLDGHFVVCCAEKAARALAWLCLPLNDESLPLGDIVLAHYLFLTSNEEKAWATAAISYIHASDVPVQLRDVVTNVAAENCRDVPF